jgi:hypothetical protein
MSSLTPVKSTSTSTVDIPKARVNNAIVKPCNPLSKSSLYHNPNIFAFFPLAQVPTGHSYFFSTISSQPASSKYSLYFFTRVQSLPILAVACMIRSTHLSSVVPFIESSIQRNRTTQSWSSKYPPGRVKLKADFITSCGI